MGNVKTLKKITAFPRPKRDKGYFDFPCGSSSLAAWLGSLFLDSERPAVMVWYTNDPLAPSGRIIGRCGRGRCRT